MEKIGNTPNNYVTRSDLARKASQRKPAEQQVLTPSQKQAVMGSFGRQGRASFVPFGKIVRS